MILLTAVVVAVALMFRAGTPAPPGSSPPPTTPSASVTTSSPGPTPTTSTSTPTSPVPTSTPTSRVTQPTATALAQLQPFLTAAGRMDRQLHAAARAVNAAGPPWVVVSPELARTVEAARLEAVARTIPAGMPDDLPLATLTVYSDLSSRRAAMDSFTNERTADEYNPTYGHQGPALLRELGHGAAAARRFDADVAALTRLARSSPDFAPARSTSRAEGERLLLLNLVHKWNWGCDARGGSVITALPAIRWTSRITGDLRMPDWTHPIPFTAVTGADGRYVSAELTVC